MGVSRGKNGDLQDVRVRQHARNRVDKDPTKGRRTSEQLPKLFSEVADPEMFAPVVREPKSVRLRRWRWTKTRPDKTWKG